MAFVLLTADSTALPYEMLALEPVQMSINTVRNLSCKFLRHTTKNIG